MIRKNGFKLIVYPDAKKAMLFDLHKDPEEKTDLAENPQNQGQAQNLFRDLMALQTEMDDDLDLGVLFEELFE